MNVRPGAYIVRNNRLLTLKYTYPGGIIHALPGGNLERGEELKAALERELQEELGIRCAPGSLLHVAEVLYQGENTIHFIFDCPDFSGELEINPEETRAEEIVWLPVDQLDYFTLYPNLGRCRPETPVFLGVIQQPRY